MASKEFCHSCFWFAKHATSGPCFCVALSIGVEGGVRMRVDKPVDRGEYGDCPYYQSREPKELGEPPPTQGYEQ